MENKSTQKPVTQEVIGALADAFGRTTWTIQRWIENNDDRLTSDRARKVFAEKGFEWNSKEEAIEVN